MTLGRRSLLIAVTSSVGAVCGSAPATPIDLGTPGSPANRGIYARLGLQTSTGTVVGTVLFRHTTEAERENTGLLDATTVIEAQGGASKRLDIRPGSCSRVGG